jgi:DNA polymerase III alpha subunit (gram-positive type)
MDTLGGGIEDAVFCAVDVETSGLYMGSRLVEVGAVRFSARGMVDEFHTLVDPMEPIPGHHERYMEYFAVYKSIYENVKGDFQALARLRGQL